MANNSKVYEMVTERVLALLDEGTVPWRKPWATEGHRNLISKRAYRGINVFLLSASGYESPWWLTYKQAKQVGAHVRRGEKSSIVVFWKWIEKRTENEDGEADDVKRFPILRYYRVFNVEQIEVPDGVISKLIDSKAIPEWPTQVADDLEPCAAADAMVNAMPDAPPITYGGDSAYYVPSLDAVTVPELSRFNSVAAFTSTRFHELVHATGHKSRTGRVKDWTGFGSEPYAQEELVAEMGAAMLNAICGLFDETADNAAAYIEGWRSKISKDPKLVVMAAAQAQKAADWIQGETHEQKQAETEAETSEREVAA